MSADIACLIAGDHKEKLLDIVVAPAERNYPEIMTHLHSSIHNIDSTYFPSTGL